MRWSNMAEVKGKNNRLGVKILAELLFVDLLTLMKENCCS